MKTICIYHSCDLDGRCSAAIVSHFIPGVLLYGMNYGEPIPWDILNKNVVYMVDFSFQPFEEMEKLQRVCSKLVWIDHHATALKDAKERNFNPKGKRVIGKGACELCWEYFTDAIISIKPIWLLGRYDVWDHKDPQVLPFQYGLNGQNTDPDSPIWNTLLSQDEEFIKWILNRGEAILEYVENNNNRYANAMSFSSILDEHPILVCNKGLTNSKLFDSVWDESQYDFVVTFCRLPSKKWTVSMYTSKENIDVGKIAKKYGGGGHKNAGGFQCQNLPFQI